MKENHGVSEALQRMVALLYKHTKRPSLTSGGSVELWGIHNEGFAVMVRKLNQMANERGVPFSPG